MGILINQAATTPVNIADILSKWEDFGVYAYLLPFLLIFAIVYGILSKAKIFGDEKGVNIIISLAVALLALLNDTVPEFFAQIFPFAGVAISILLVALILMGMFGDINVPGAARSTFFVIGAILAIVVVYLALSGNAWGGVLFWDRYGPAIIILAVIVAIIGLITKGFGGGGGAGSTVLSPTR